MPHPLETARLRLAAAAILIATAESGASTTAPMQAAREAFEGFFGWRGAFEPIELSGGTKVSFVLPTTRDVTVVVSQNGVELDPIIVYRLDAGTGPLGDARYLVDAWQHHRELAEQYRSTLQHGASHSKTWKAIAEHEWTARAAKRELLAYVRANAESFRGSSLAAVRVRAWLDSDQIGFLPLATALCY